MTLRDDQVRIAIAGEYACFTRPEYKIERRSYDLINPSAAEGVLEAVYWHPGVRYQIDRVLLMEPIRWTTLTINELKMPTMAKPMAFDRDRIVKTSTVLRNVGYVVEATVLAPTRDEVLKAKHIFDKRLRRGQTYKRPYLGQNAFAARVWWLDATPRPLPITQEFGWMFHSRTWEGDRATGMRFFNARLIDGVMDTGLNEVMTHAA